MQNARFVKLSATMVGVNEVKQAVEVAKNERKFNRKTILFMDEIHRFNKMQQVRLESPLDQQRLEIFLSILSGHFSTTRGERYDNTDRRDNWKSFIQLEFGPAESMSRHSSGEIE